MGERWPESKVGGGSCYYFDIVSREAYEALSRVMIDDYVTMPCEPQPADI